MAKDSSEAAQLLAASLLISIITSLASLITVFIIFSLNIITFSAPNLTMWLLLTPIGIISTGLSLSLRSFLHFHKEYRYFASTPIIFSLAYGFLALTLYYIWPSGLTLILCQILATLVVCVFIFQLLKSKGYLNETITIQRITNAAVRKKQYALISTPSSLLDGLSQALPIYFMAIAFNSITVASYGIMIKIVIVPMRFIFSSISTLMLKIIHDEINSANRCRIFWQISCGLLVLIVLASQLISNYADTIVDQFLGDEWSQTIVVIETMCFASLFGAAVSSLSNIFAATNRLQLGASWQVLYFTVTLVFFLYVVIKGNIPQQIFFELLAIKELVSYTIYFLLISFSVHKPKAS
ncbi:hypothetical protein [Nereida ignava]|uniref:hypothetical protein n=1 Tax=Nereida ignava TaxID=282199 RepID=UPI002FE3ECE8